MADDLSNRGPQERAQMNVHEEQDDVRYWTAAYDVTEAELRLAVAAVGTSSEAVREHLGRWPKKRTVAGTGPRDCFDCLDGGLGRLEAGDRPPNVQQNWEELCVRFSTRAGAPRARRDRPADRSQGGSPEPPE